jgi:hypothetical protein
VFLAQFRPVRQGPAFYELEGSEHPNRDLSAAIRWLLWVIAARHDVGISVCALELRADAESNRPLNSGKPEHPRFDGVRECTQGPVERQAPIAREQYWARLIHSAV